MAESNCGAFEAEDIVKYGYMMIKRPPTSTKVRIKAWQSKFFVLRDKTPNFPQRLEYYKDESAFEFQKSAEHCFYLDSIVYIGETHSSKSHCYPIMVVCSKQGAFTLGCDIEEATTDWIHALNQVAVKVGGTGSPDMWMYASVDDSPANTPELPRHAYSEISSGALLNLEEQVPQGKLTRTRTINSPTTGGYFVTTRLTPHSEKNNIRGDYMLRVTEGEVVLQSAVDWNVIIVTWPVGYLRAFKSEHAVSAGVKDMQLLTLNVGRRSATGEGIFQFFTKHGDTIAHEIRRQSQHAFKSAAEKREAFVHGRSSTSSEGKSPTLAHPDKHPRTMTEPPERLARVLTKKDRVPLADSLRRSRAETDPSLVQKLEKNGAVDDQTCGSTSSNDARPRSATDSSVEKTGDDEVFLTQSAYCEIDSGDGLNDEPDTNDASAYIELLSDDTAEPIHISDPVPSRKISNESQTSMCSIASDDGNMRTCPLPRNLSGPQLIPEEHEMDSEGYIKCEALQTGPGENNLDGNANVVGFLGSENAAENLVFDTSGIQSGSFSRSPVELTTMKSGGLELSPASSRINRKLRENLVSQIRDSGLGTFPPKPKLESQRALMSENVFPPTSRTDEEEPRSSEEIDSAHALLEKARDPESSKKLLDQILAQMEKPQQNDVSELFPATTRKRNSIGAVSMESVREAQQKSKGGHSFNSKKHSVIEKSKSTCDGFLSRALSPGPPPLPLRPDSAELARRRVCSSVGDLSEELHKRPDLMGAHRSTFFAKGLKSVNPQTLMAPLRTNITPGQLGGEAAIHARLIEKTEIRDELAQSASSSRGKAAGDDVSTCLMANGGSATCPIADETLHNSADFLEKCRVRSTENLDEDAHDETVKRKDSKASKFVKKVWKLAPKPRRGSNESRDINEEFSAASEKPRRDSLSPGDIVDLQSRFSESEPNTPESSPQMRRKNSKTSPKDSRKTSMDEKSKKDKESSTSKILRKVTKGDSKKEESFQKSPVRKVSRDDSPKKDGLSNDIISKHSSPMHHKAATPEKGRKHSKDEKPKQSHEHEEMIDRFHQGDGYLGRVSESRRSPTNDLENPAPALPPRKRFEPPPLPPRLSKSSPSLCSVASTAHSTPPHHSTRAPQPVAPSSSREGRRHSNTSSRRHSGSGQKEELLPPPPVPPRNSQSPEPKKTPTANERSSARAPVIQLTCSSPENRDDSLEKLNSDSEEAMTNATSNKTAEQNPPILSATHQSPESLSHPVPRRPPKGERRSQAKEFFRSHVSQRVYVPTSDSDGGEMEDSDFPPHSPRYGNIEAIRMAMQTGDYEGAAAKEHAPRGASRPQTHETTESNCISPPPMKLSLEEVRVIKSQRDAMRLKINLMKESSVDEDGAFESDDGEDLEEQSKPKRPSTPLSIQRNVLTLSSVSIN